MRDGNGELVLIEGSAGWNNTLEHNQASGNTRFEGTDANPACDNNRWRHNRFTTVNQPCVD